MKSLFQILATACLFSLWASGAGAQLRMETVPEHPAPGAVFEIRLFGVEANGRPEARLGARSFPLWSAGDGGWQGLGAVDRDETLGSRDLVVVDVTGGGEVPLGVLELRFESRNYGIQKITVDESKVTLSRHDQDRVNRENETILSVLAGRSAERLWASPFRVPVAGDITGTFGVRREYNGKPKGYHNGVDISAPRGAVVTAPAAGRVALVGEYFMTGWTVVLDHGLGLYTAYFHMDSVETGLGSVLGAGAPIGRVGSTGRSTGPHLHWGVYVSGVRGDPESLLRVSAELSTRGAQTGLAEKERDDRGQKMP